MKLTSVFKFINWQIVNAMIHDDSPFGLVNRVNKKDLAGGQANMLLRWPLRPIGLVKQP
jgi:hypothetical protein